MLSNYKLELATWQCQCGAVYSNRRSNEGEQSINYAATWQSNLSNLIEIFVSFFPSTDWNAINEKEIHKTH